MVEENSTSQIKTRFGGKSCAQKMLYWLAGRWLGLEELQTQKKLWRGISDRHYKIISLIFNNLKCSYVATIEL